LITKFIVMRLGCHPIPAARAAAEKRALQLKCSGAFAMGEQQSSGRKKSRRDSLSGGRSDGGDMDALRQLTKPE
jgi:hypothetical protein